MAAVSLHRKVLILMDGPTIRNLLNLLRKLQSESRDEGSAGAVSAMSDPRSYDAVVLDLRCTTERPGGEVHGIGRVHPAMLGRVLAITAETGGPNTLDLVERYLVSGLPSTLLWLVSHRYKPA